jgi:hypothetical protein
MKTFNYLKQTWISSQTKRLNRQYLQPSKNWCLKLLFPIECWVKRAYLEPIRNSMQNACSVKSMGKCKIRRKKTR